MKGEFGKSNMIYLNSWSGECIFVKKHCLIAISFKIKYEKTFNELSTIPYQSYETFSTFVGVMDWLHYITASTLVGSTKILYWTPHALKIELVSQNLLWKLCIKSISIHGTRPFLEKGRVGLQLLLSYSFFPYSIHICVQLYY